jgi:hypothetical protein
VNPSGGWAADPAAGRSWAHTNPATLNPYNNVEMIHVPPHPMGGIVRVFVRAAALVAANFTPPLSGQGA